MGGGLGWLAGGAAALAVPIDEWWIDWGPLYSRRTETNGAVVVRAAGPLFERRLAGEASGLAFRPVYTREVRPDMNRVEGELLWPLGEYSARSPEAGWRVGVAWYRCFDTSAERPRWRFWLLPIYLQGRGASGRAYAAVFPLGGRIEEFLGLDEYVFAWWPLWSKSRINRQTTTDVLFPIWSRTTGPNADRLRVFPFWGRSTRHDRHEKRFILWPVWTWARYDHPASHGTGWILFPFYGRLDLSDQTSQMWLPPFFRIAHAEQMNRFDMPWPFIRYQTGQRNQLHIWPLFGRTTDPRVDRSYIAWPIAWRLRVARPTEVTRSYWVLPFLHYRRTEPRLPPADLAAPRPPAAVEWKVWPLADGEQAGDRTRWRALSLWPTRNLTPVERSWAPLWTLVEYRRDGADLDVEALWGMVRRHRDEYRSHVSLFPLFERSSTAPPDGPASGRFSFLKGLIGWAWAADGERLQVLYGLTIRLKGAAPSSSTSQTTSTRR